VNKMGCGCRGRNKKTKPAPRFTKCNFCGRIDVPLPLKSANKRGSKVICKDCILKGVGL